MSESKDLLIEYRDAVGIVTINRPEKRNTVSPDTLLELGSELKKLRDEGNVRCLILRGAGDKAFSAGYDISAIGRIDNDMMKDYMDDHPLTVANRAIESFPYPVVAMINGHAFGAGLELAITCDLRVSVDMAILGMPPAKLGVTYTYSGIRKFLNLIGLGYTKEMFLTGRNVDAVKAERIGLVNYTVTRAELEEFTYKLAAEISENAPLSMSTMKGMMNAWQRNQTATAADEEVIKAMIVKVQESDDYREGQKAFAEKRKPKYKGA